MPAGPHSHVMALPHSQRRMSTPVGSETERTSWRFILTAAARHTCDEPTAQEQADRVRPAAMHGMRVSRVVRTAAGEPATHWGTITYTGADARTKCLMMQWEDGCEEGPLAARSLRHLYGRPVPAALPLQNSALRDMTTHTVQQTGT